tara:strand:- start:277 stop:1155 length:879 start_codon:yes stop_codon:yes gene_type:complete
MINLNTRSIGILSTSIGAMLIGVAPILVRTSEITPSLTGFYRFLVATFILFVYGVAKKKFINLSYKDIPFLAIPGLFFGCDITLWHWSINQTSVANASLFVNTAPIYVAIISYFLFKDKLDLFFYFAGFCCLGGVFLILFKQNEHQSFTGDLLSLTAAVFYSGYLISVKKFSENYETFNLMFFSALFGCIPLYLGSLLEIGQTIPETIFGWSNILFQGLFIQITGQGLIIYGLTLIRVQFSSLILLIQPLTATFLAFLLFKEMFLMQQIFGAIILLVGIYLAGISDQKTIKN